MCTICGCGGANPADSHRHHDHDHGHGRHHDHTHDDGDEAARLLRVERDILGANDAHATANRAFFAEQGLFALNLVSSPGSGKTTLLARTIADLRPVVPIAVIEGDQQTSRDADRIRAAGAPAVQINTGKACHLDAHAVGHAARALPLPAGGLLFIENVGNLVCPAAFDLGEAHKVVILSVTEGDDKPLKYPDMFAAAGLMLIAKSDLLPHVAFDAARCIDYARRVNPGIAVLTLSAADGRGLDAWYAWLAEGRKTARRNQIALLDDRLREACAGLAAET